MPSLIGVNNIQSHNPPDIAPILLNGLSVASGFALTCSGGINITGVVTATSFSGNGSAITNLPLATIGQAVGQTVIFG